MNGAPIWLFDGHCLLCARSVQYTLRHERVPHIRFVALQSDEGRALAQTHGIDPDNPESFLFIEHGIAHQKSTALFALLKHLNGPARALLLARYLPHRWTDWAYLKIAANRYRLFGKSDHCILPNPAERTRFTLPEERP